MKKDQMRHFVVIFSSAFTAVLILLYLLISQDPGCLRQLLLAVIPSMVATQILFIGIYFLLDRNGVNWQKSLADEILMYLHGDSRRGNSSQVDLQGRWKLQDWKAGEPDSKDYSDDVQVYQDGDKYWGTFTVRRKSETSKRVVTRYAFTGTIEGFIVTGRWWQLGGSNPWKGLMQFKFTPGDDNKEVMEGQWIGFSKDQKKINYGPWEWARPDHTFPSERS